MTIQSFFKKTPLQQRVFSIALPMLLANLSTPLLGLVDTAILGHLDSPLYLGAVALGAQLITLIFWSFGFLRMGTTGFTSRSLGAGELEKVGELLTRSVIFGIAASILILLLQTVALDPLVRLMTAEPELYKNALGYSEIRIWSAPATLITYALIGWLIGVQKTRFAMVVMVALNLLNIILDYLFIVEFDLRSNGAAWASLISEYVGLGLAAALALKASRDLSVPMQKFPSLDWQNYIEFITSSRHLFVRTLCLLFCFLFFAAQGAKFGENTLAANAILLNLLALAAYTMDGFAYAAETLGGEAWGAKNRRLFRNVIVQTWILAFSIALIATLILLLGKPWILGIYTDIPTVTAVTYEFYLWLALLPLIAIHSYQLDGIFIGVGKTRAMQNAMLASCFLVFLPCWYFLRDFQNTGLWLSFWAFHIARSMFLVPPFIRILRTELVDR